MKQLLVRGESMSIAKLSRVETVLAAVLLIVTFSVPVQAQTGADRHASGNAELLLLNGKIITMDAGDSIAQAVAIHDGKIVAVGSNDEVRQHAASNARIIDLHGRTATPGLIDTHCHFDETAKIYDLDLSNVKSVSEVVEMVRQKVAKTPPNVWVRGEGWDESKLAELRYIYASDLDKVSPNNPVWLTHTTGHYGVANSQALRLAKITTETKNPPAGIIDRDSKGQPSGVLKEDPAMEMVVTLIPPYSHEQQRNGLLKMMADFNKEGMTAAKDPGILPERWELYEELLRENKSTVRIFALLLGGTTMDTARATLSLLQLQPTPPESMGDGMLLSGGVKLFMDGSGGGRTAWVYEPWFKKAIEIDPGNTGYPALDPATYQQMVGLFHDAGIHVSTHAVGDRAIDWVVDTYAGVLQKKPTKGLRHGIIHCNIPSDHAIDTMSRLQKEYEAGYPETQAPFLWWIGDTYAGTFGAKRDARQMPFKTYLEKQMIWGGGSDYFVTPYPARYGLWSSVARQTLNGVYGSQPFGTLESVDIHTALKSYTIWAAHQLFLEKRIGSLEPGKDADIAVWDRDLYSIPTDDLKNIQCELTLLKGKTVYRDEKSPVSGVGKN
jgi:predicted amidohydrolase YtcJ